MSNLHLKTENIHSDTTQVLAQKGCADHSAAVANPCSASNESFGARIKSFVHKGGRKAVYMAAAAALLVSFPVYGGNNNVPQYVTAPAGIMMNGTPYYYGQNIVYTYGNTVPVAVNPYAVTYGNVVNNEWQVIPWNNATGTPQSNPSAQTRYYVRNMQPVAQRMDYVPTKVLNTRGYPIVRGEETTLYMYPPTYVPAPVMVVPENPGYVGNEVFIVNNESLNMLPPAGPEGTYVPVVKQRQPTRTTKTHMEVQPRRFM